MALRTRHYICTLYLAGRLGPKAGEAYFGLGNANGPVTVDDVYGVAADEDDATPPPPCGSTGRGVAEGAEQSHPKPKSRTTGCNTAKVNSGPIPPHPQSLSRLGRGEVLQAACMTSAPFCPPNPKLVLRPTRGRLSWAVMGT